MATLNVRGATLHYELHGKMGEPLLLIQGVGVNGTGWQPQVDGLSTRYRVLTFDNRGIGKSSLTKAAPFSIELMAEDALALMDEAGWDSCHVGGHSMGGVIAQRLAINHPTRVRSLSLLCTVARGADAVRLTPGTIWTALRTKFGSKPSRRRAFLELIYPKDFLANVDCSTLATGLAAQFGHDLAEQPPVAVKQAMALRRHDCRKDLPQLGGIPTLVVSASHDPIALPRFGRELASSIPGARFIEIPGSSHGLPLQHAGTINDLLADLFCAATASHSG